MSRTTTRKATLAALADLRLTDRAIDDARPVEVAVDADGAPHKRYSSCDKRTMRRPESVRWTVRDLVEQPVLCPHCEEGLIASAFNGHDIAFLLDTHARAATATRVTRTGKMSAASVKLLRRLEADHQNLVRSKSPYVDAVTDLTERTAAAIAALTRLAGGDEAKDAALAQCVEALVPKQLRGKVHLDDERTLIAIVPTMRGSDAIRRVLAALVFAPDLPGQFLLGPRYVVDYLYKEMYRGSADAFIAAAPVGAASDEQIRHAATLWEATGGGPMSSLPVALRVACDLHA